MLTETINLFLMLVGVLGGVWIGHTLTMKAFSHVQPSTKELIEKNKGGIVTEPDPWAIEGSPSDMPEEYTGMKSPEDIIEKIREKTGRTPEEMYGVNN